jgi:hypothetical protein
MGARDCQREKQRGWRREVAGCEAGEFIVVVMHLLFPFLAVEGNFNIF